MNPYCDIVSGCGVESNLLDGYMWDKIELSNIFYNDTNCKCYLTIIFL